jgi:hypothetical protein
MKYRFGEELVTNIIEVPLTNIWKKKGAGEYIWTKEERI